MDDKELFEILKNNKETIKQLIKMGILNKDKNDTQSYNVGSSDYSRHIIQPWNLWIDYNLNPFDADIVKRILRTKRQFGLTLTESRIEDFKKIIHISKERIRQLEIIKNELDYDKNNSSNNINDSQL